MGYDERQYMTSIAIAPRGGYGNTNRGELLGVKQSRAEEPIPFEHASGTLSAQPKSVPSELEKTVRKMPTLYVIAFFGVVVACAVLIIWNTLQVNKLAAERVKLDDQIAQTEQRLIRLRAMEMQLSAPDRIRAIAAQKLGMSPASAEDIVVIK